MAHYVHRTEPGLKHLVDEYNVKESPVEHLEIGYRYHSEALFTDGPLNASNITEDPATALAAPGSMAYHVLVDTADGQNDVAISEFFGDGFVLFVGPKGETWIEAVASFNTQDWPLKVIQLTFDKNSAFSKRYGVFEDGVVLVRPDGFVAWSCISLGSVGVESTQKLLEQVRQRVLCVQGSRKRRRDES